MCLCMCTHEWVKGALHQKGSNDMIWHNKSDPPPPEIILICTNPKFLTTQKYIIKLKAEENNSLSVVVFFSFCVFFSLLFLQWSLMINLHTPMTVECLLFGKVWRWDGQAREKKKRQKKERKKKALVLGGRCRNEGVMPTKVIPTLKKYTLSGHHHFNMYVLMNATTKPSTVHSSIKATFHQSTNPVRRLSRCRQMPLCSSAQLCLKSHKIKNKKYKIKVQTHSWSLYQRGRENVLTGRLRREMVAKDMEQVEE